MTLSWRERWIPSRKGSIQTIWRKETTKAHEINKTKHRVLPWEGITHCSDAAGHQLDEEQLCEEGPGFLMDNQLFWGLLWILAAKRPSSRNRARKSGEVRGEKMRTHKQQQEVQTGCQCFLPYGEGCPGRLCRLHPSRIFLGFQKTAGHIPEQPGLSLLWAGSWVLRFPQPEPSYSYWSHSSLLRRCQGLFLRTALPSLRRFLLRHSLICRLHTKPLNVGKHYSMEGRAAEWCQVGTSQTLLHPAASPLHAVLVHHSHVPPAQV